jgi:hypothetical protein
MKFEPFLAGTLGSARSTNISSHDATRVSIGVSALPEKKLFMLYRPWAKGHHAERET